MGPQGRSGLVRKNLNPTGIRYPDRPARSESLYRLSYRGPLLDVYKMTISQILSVWVQRKLVRVCYTARRFEYPKGQHASQTFIQ